MVPVAQSCLAEEAHYIVPWSCSTAAMFYTAVLYPVKLLAAAYSEVPFTHPELRVPVGAQLVPVTIS